jgi:hypothetical protein
MKNKNQLSYESLLAFKYQHELVFAKKRDHVWMAIKGIAPSFSFLKQLSYSPQAWYAVTQLEKQLAIIKLLPKVRSKLPEGKFYNQAENLIFETFSESEWSQEFLEHPSLSLKERALFILQKSLDQILHFAIRTWSLKIPLPKTGPQALLEVGEMAQRKSGKLAVTCAPNFFVSFQGYHLQVFGVPKREQAKQKLRLELALANLYQFAPKSFARVKALTHTIVAVKDAGIVSYSSQDLPGFSSINLWHRDDLDLLDDLVHESGHHFLNLILSQKKLIVENQEELFYSPWRKTPRPIRGIYHGYLTFYWALKLFEELQSNQFPLQKTKQKKRWREEFKLLRACHPILKEAYGKGLITPLGKFLYQEVMKDLI